MSKFEFYKNEVNKIEIIVKTSGKRNENCETQLQTYKQKMNIPKIILFRNI